jgi:leucyl aminopeptidase
MNIVKINSIEERITKIYLISVPEDANKTELTSDEQKYIMEKYKEKENTSFSFNRFTHYIHVMICPEELGYKSWEKLRKAGDKLLYFLNKRKINEAIIISFNVEKSFTLAFTEGMALGGYNFGKYKTPGENQERFSKIVIYGDSFYQKEIDDLNNLTEACYHTRDLVNEPANELTAEIFADRIRELATSAGLHVDVLDKDKITELGMTGLLTVNKGSVEKPAFIILEWKPAYSDNDQPYVLVGKGLVFDTGGINLKPGNSLDGMKSDMAGGAAVFGTMYALAKNNSPVHVVGLIPATDNRLGGQAMVPGDVIRMANGKTVEVINTDAEGRIILADALHYAKKYNPAIVIDLATLTGSAAMAIGKYGVVGMHSNALPEMGRLIESSYNVYERVVEFPFWEEYDKEIESDIADIRNLGLGKGAGAITAGKFLSNFIDYPWIHLDIAGMAFMDGRESYLGKGGTAVGVRLLYDFLGKVNSKH